MPALNIVIVEDEPVVARRLLRLVRDILPSAAVRVTHALGEARSALSSCSPDVLLLDLNLRGEDGFGLLREAMASPAETIVVSANEERAMEAFELGVADFVPKPFDQARLALAFNRIKDVNQRLNARFLSVRHAGALEVIPIDDLVALHAAGDYSELELRSGGPRLHEKSLIRLEAILPQDFMRIHKSHIVRLTSIERLRSEPGSRYTVAIRDGAELPVSRRIVKTLRERLNQVP